MSVMEVDVMLPEPELSMSDIKQIKNAVIGNRNQKEKFVQNQIIPKLLRSLCSNETAIELKVECVDVLNSLAKGSDYIVQCIVDAGIVPVLLKDIQHTDIKYSEACLRCLRTLVCRRSLSSTSGDSIFTNAGLVPFLVNTLRQSSSVQECIATILSQSCTTHEHQVVLCASGAVSALSSLLSTSAKNQTVLLPVLHCLTVLCYKNAAVSTEIVSATCNSESLVTTVAQFLAPRHSTELQMAAAKCLTYLYRSGAIAASDHVIAFKTLPTLIRQCKADRKWEVRVEGAETLAYLIEVDVTLQNIASVSDQIITTLSEYFKYPGSPPDANLMPTTKDDITVGNELRQAAFRAYASLCANNEDVRKQVIETKNLMGHVVNGLSDLVPKVQVAAIRCLHSLSRSVRQLRTSFQDHEVWKPIRPILLNTTDEAQLMAVTSIACNLLLEFSPSKEHMLQDGQAMVDRLVDLTRHQHPGIRLNAVWALMNMTFKCDQKFKNQVLQSVRSDDLFRLLADSEVDIVMKTLGLLRNLVSSRSHVDSVMSETRLPIIGAVIMTLEAGQPTIVKEQALCILTNIANGNSSKDLIMGNDDLVGKIANYLTNSNICLQIAATLCIANLVRTSKNEDGGDKLTSGATGRQQKLREMGVDKMLQVLLTSADTNLTDAVKGALQHF